MLYSAWNGIEFLNLNQDGADFVGPPSGGDCYVQALQVRIKLGPSVASKTSAGDSVALCNAFFHPTMPQFGTGGANKAAAFLAPNNTDWVGSPQIINPYGVAIGDSGTIGYGVSNPDKGAVLFVAVLDANLPNNPDRFEGFFTYPAGGIYVPAGSRFIFHADLAGVQADLEGHVVYFYTVK